MAGRERLTFLTNQPTDQLQPVVLSQLQSAGVTAGIAWQLNRHRPNSKVISRGQPDQLCEEIWRLVDVAWCGLMAVVKNGNGWGWLIVFVIHHCYGWVWCKMLKVSHGYGSKMLKAPLIMFMIHGGCYIYHSTGMPSHSHERAWALCPAKLSCTCAVALAPLCCNDIMPKFYGPPRLLSSLSCGHVDCQLS